MEGKASLDVRRGAWTKEEDDLLKHCVNKYGEGNWSKVPIKAGLNRCRKSCRMRWLNYLKPGVNNGEFTEDEVELLLRLHKLLGNRWSLIAGRLPGRTSNSVKNYWNTHLRKKVILEDHQKHLKENNDPQKILTKSNILKPRPQRFKKHLPSMKSTNLSKIQPQNDNQSEPSPLEDTSLWERLLDDHGNFDEVITHSLSWSEEELLPDYFSIEELDQNAPNIGDIISDNHWRDYVDLNLWGPFDK